MDTKSWPYGANSYKFIYNLWYVPVPVSSYTNIDSTSFIDTKTRTCHFCIWFKLLNTVNCQWRLQSDDITVTSTEWTPLRQTLRSVPLVSILHHKKNHDIRLLLMMLRFFVVVSNTFTHWVNFLKDNHIWE